DDSRGFFHNKERWRRISSNWRSALPPAVLPAHGQRTAQTCYRDTDGRQAGCCPGIAHAVTHLAAVARGGRLRRRVRNRRRRRRTGCLPYPLLERERRRRKLVARERPGGAGGRL